MDQKPTGLPGFIDAESFQDFVDAMSDLAPAIERDVGKLRQDPSDRAVIADLFRAFHNIKGDASLCRFDLAVRIAHPIESLLARLREGSISFTPLVGEAILLALDRLELAIDAIIAARPSQQLRLDVLIPGLERLSLAAPGEIVKLAGAVIEAVTGFRPTSHAHAHEIPPLAVDRDGDLGFFRDLAMQLEARSPLLAGRTDRNLHLALATNRAAGQPVDELQLEAAVYMHDIGMMLLPENLWMKPGKLSDAERLMLRAHPGQASGLLMRMPGWQEAAEIVMQHHEMADGSGYPAKLSADRIVPGAQILAIVDAFEAVMLKHGDRGRNRSLLRAIAEVNASERQFSPRFIAPFNTVVRELIEHGHEGVKGA